MGAITGRQLVQLDEAWAAAAASNDLNAVMDYWTEDAVLFPEGQAPRYGKLEIREFLERRRSSSAYRISWSPTCAGVDQRGSMAYTLGQGTATIVDDSGATRELAGRYVAIWRQDDGRWRCAVKCWNTSPDQGKSGRKSE